jgi:hypothetical protein
MRVHLAFYRVLSYGCSAGSRCTCLTTFALPAGQRRGVRCVRARHLPGGGPCWVALAGTAAAFLFQWLTGAACAQSCTVV